MSSRNRMIVIGSLVGAVLGAIAAWSYAQNRDYEQLEGRQMAGQMRLQASMPDYVKVGMSLMSLVRQIVDLFKTV